MFGAPVEEVWSVIGVGDDNRGLQANEPLDTGSEDAPTFLALTAAFPLQFPTRRLAAARRPATGSAAWRTAKARS